MCGIAGVLTRDNAPVKKSWLKAMADSLVHRGPDGEGMWVGQGAEAGLGVCHRRLSILDHEGGAQPMATQDQQIQVVFNGQIYNHLDLRRELESLGHAFVSDHSDTEVLVHGYRQWGAGLCERLAGMYAFAAFDQKRRTLLLARDQMGQKPLYLAGPSFFDAAQSRIQFAFASELNALCLLPGAKREIDPLALGRFLIFDFVPAPNAIYTGVTKMPPGQHLELELAEKVPADLRPALRTHWDLGFGRVDLPRGKKERQRLLVETLSEAVGDRLVADVPVGIFLSGGIDSSLVAALAKRHASEVRTFSIGFTEKSYDESSHARLVAQKLGTTHHEEIFDVETLREVLPTIADHLAEPFADHSVIPTYLLSRLTRESVTVALGGDGGDELFLGYDTFVAEKLRRPRLFKDRPLTRFSVDALQRVARLLPVDHANMSLDFKLQQLTRGLLEERPARRHQLFLTGMDATFLGELLSFDMNRELFSGGVAEAPFDLLDAWEARGKGAGAQDTFDALTYTYARSYLAEGVLQKVDRATMAVSLEARAPMMDDRFVDLALSFPSSDKLRGFQKKAILKDAARGLIPDSIIDRPKKGFGIPVASWLAGPLRDTLQDYLSPHALRAEGFFEPNAVGELVREHVDKKRNHRKTLWSLFMFHWWLNRVHKALPPPISAEAA
jgi:asparagine synthase (glutamine-hydrolysing)